MTLGLLCPSAPAVEGIDRPEVRIDNFRLEPFANYVTRGGRNEFHPKAMLGFGFDSNVYATPEDEVADGYARTVVGIEGRMQPGIFDLLVYDLELQAKIFAQEDDRSMIGGRFQGEWAHEGVDMASSLKLKWSRIDDPQVEGGRRIQRSNYDATFEFGRQGYFGQWVADARVGREVYHEDGTTFTAEERNSWRARVGGGLTWNFSRTAEVRGEGVVGIRRYGDGDRFNDNWWLSALGSCQGRLGDRTVLTAIAGLEGRFYQDDFLGIDAFDDQIVIRPIADILLRWQYDAFSRVDARLTSSLQDGSTANAVWIYGFQSEWLHRIDDRWRAGASGYYHFVRNSGAAAGQPVDLRRTLHLGLLGEVELVRGIGGRASLGYTTSTADVSNDFDRIEARVEAAIVF